MFGIGGIEFLIIAIIAIVVIGPSELPRVLYTLGKGMRKMRQVSKAVTDTFDDVTREAELQDIVSKSNIPGGEDIDFHTEQQLALERRREAEKQKKQPAKTKASTNASAKKAGVKKTSAKKAKKKTGQKTTAKSASAKKPPSKTGGKS
ncbi:MAG: Sec-independent protein translocase subunit TatA/TatB [Pseudomonadota bacterium]